MVQSLSGIFHKLDYHRDVLMRIEIRYSPPPPFQGLDLSGTPQELRVIADAIEEMIESDQKSILFNANTEFDPTPYNFVIPTLKVQIGVGPTKVSVTDEELLIEGAPIHLNGLLASLRCFWPTARSPEHTHFEHFDGCDWISPDSAPLVISIREPREADLE